MDWKEALAQLTAAMPKLAFKPELIAKMNEVTREAKPPGLLMDQVATILAVTKQNQRIAEQYGYASLEVYAKQVEVACTNLISALRTAGMSAPKNVVA